MTAIAPGFASNTTPGMTQPETQPETQPAIVSAPPAPNPAGFPAAIPETTDSPRTPTGQATTEKVPEKPMDPPADQSPAPLKEKLPEVTPDASADPKKPQPPAASTPDPMVRTPEEEVRYQKFLQADRLYQAGNRTAAAAIYKELKTPFTEVTEAQPQPAAITDPAELPPAGKVYLREAQAGLDNNLESRATVALDLLTKNYPQYIPGQLLRIQHLEKLGKSEEALQALETLSGMYPNDTELLKAKITALAKVERWVDASIAARQFALFNPDHPQASEFTKIADENLTLYRRSLRRKLTGNVIGNVITGAIGYAVTGGIFGPLTAIQSATILLRGESAIGDRVTQQVKKQVEMVKDEDVNQYITDLGNKIAKVAGREDFKYEFNVILDDNLNAFALPGGKVFLNAGAIAKANSEAELIGLLGHEISHAVLGHGFQLLARGNLTASIAGYIPYVGGIATDVIVFNYSRDMERQADDLGTRLAVSTGYAADGLRNLMLTMRKEDEAKKRNPPPDWLSTHPGSKERLRNLETTIVRSRYDRYAFEGVERHDTMKQKVAQLLKEHKEKQEKNRS
ncbi:MAG: M48 family metalloprotease [Synechococcales bacterium]|nr:M48 family metalloprotease [Synechococcales bacterium]